MGERLVARVVFIGILGLTALLERLQYQLGANEASPWWASNGRDVINAFAFSAMAVGLGLLGFSGPLCLLVAGAIVILLTGIQSSLERQSHAMLASIGASLVLGLPVVLRPEAIRAGLERLTALLVP